MVLPAFIDGRIRFFSRVGSGWIIHPDPQPWSLTILSVILPLSLAIYISPSVLAGERERERESERTVALRSESRHSNRRSKRDKD